MPLQTESCVHGWLARWSVCCLNNVCAATCLSIDADLYSGTPVTHCDGDAMSAEPETRRLDRCFIVGKHQTANRSFLRVIAGVRRSKGDPATLDHDDFDSCILSCPPASRLALSFSTVSSSAGCLCVILPTLATSFVAELYGLSLVAANRGQEKPGPGDEKTETQADRRSRRMSFSVFV